MENPEHEIRSVVRSLCQGTADEQRRALDQYFTKDVSFVHPFCTVPHFSKAGIPILGRLSSRDVVRSIFQWYRMMSPKIDIQIDSALHDRVREKMYLDMRQTFSIWFIPLYSAHVRLVTVLDLVDSDSPDYHDPLDRMLKQQGGGRGDEGATKGAGQDHRNGSRKTNDDHDNHHHKHGGSRTWKISKQEDLYQVTDFLKFAGGPGPFPFLWYLFQLGASAACVFLSLLLPVTPWAYQKNPARGGVEATVECVDSPVSTASFCDQDAAQEDDNDAASTGGASRNKALGGGGGSEFVSGEDSGHTGGSGGPVGGGPVGGDGDGGSNNNNHSSSSSSSNNNNNANTNGHRRGSSNSKASSSSIPKKSRKNGNSGRKKAAAA